MLMAIEMSRYEKSRWSDLNDHWSRRANRRGLPNWINDAGEAVADRVGGVARRAADAAPDWLTNPVKRATAKVMDVGLQPAMAAALRLLELVDDWAMEMTDPANVVRAAQGRGVDITSIDQLRGMDLKSCDRLVEQAVLKARTLGAVEGGVLGALANVPYAGIPLSVIIDTVVVQVISVVIATRIAYSYGFDAKDPAERAFIEHLVKRSFTVQAVKVGPVRDAGRAAEAIRRRLHWSQKLRDEHQIIAALEKLMAKWYPHGARVPVQHVGKVVPFVSVVIGMGANAWVIGQTAQDARRFCATRFLCDKYALELPAALKNYGDEDADASGEEDSSDD